MSFKNQVIRGTKWTTIGTVVLAITALLKVSILARYLEKTDFGLMALVTLVIGFTNLFNDMGLTSAILHKQDISKKEYGSLYWLNLLIGIIMFGLISLVAYPVSLFYEEPSLIYLIPLLGINLIISSIGRMFKTMEQKDLLFKQIVIIDIAAALLSLAFSVYLAMSGYGIYALIYPSILQMLLMNIPYLVLGLKKYGLLFRLKFQETRPFLKIGIYQVGGQMVNYFNRDLDILIIGKFFDSELLGGYSLARELVRKPITILLPIINKVGAPTLSKYANDVKILTRYFLKMVNVLATVTIPFYLLLAIFASVAVNILYGNDFLSIVVLVQILCFNMIFRVIGGSIGNLVIATGRTDIDFYWNLITLFITPLFVILGSYYSLEMVAIMVTISSIVLLIPSYYYFVKKLTSASLTDYLTAYFRLNFKQFIKF